MQSTSTALAELKAVIEQVLRRHGLQASGWFWELLIDGCHERMLAQSLGTDVRSVRRIVNEVRRELMVG